VEFVKVFYSEICVTFVLSLFIEAVSAKFRLLSGLPIISYQRYV